MKANAISIQQRRAWRRWAREFLSRASHGTPTGAEMRELVRALERVADRYFRRGARLAARKLEARAKS